MLGEGHHGRVLRGTLRLAPGLSQNRAFFPGKMASPAAAAGRMPSASLAASTEVPCAVKEVLPGVEAMTELLVEACLLRALNHPNIVSLFGLCADASPVWLVMEHCEGGDLRGRLKSLAAVGAAGHGGPQSDHDGTAWAQRVREGGMRPLPRTDMVTVLQHTAAALVYLHSKTCLHRDLAARNILLKRGPVRGVGKGCGGVGGERRGGVGVGEGGKRPERG